MIAVIRFIPFRSIVTGAEQNLIKEKNTRPRNRVRLMAIGLSKLKSTVPIFMTTQELYKINKQVLKLLPIGTVDSVVFT